ncbi:hypothetical protein CARUB_v10015536mg [Capsella rubella]|uniref:Retrotransposon gag domain-containing protein n=1 Tax=Capsella rubella TaxID=81985 RepID=R0I2W6_9BRAS|nr:hypothetical protein CARUB_v10015536mg [Capsella rubella]
MPPNPDAPIVKPPDDTINWREFHDALLESQRSIQRSLAALVDAIQPDRVATNPQLAGVAALPFSRIVLDIPEFHGGISGDSLLDWFVTVDELLDFKSVPDNRRVSLVAPKFRGHAASWWQQTKLTRARNWKAPIQTWDKLKKQLRKTFMPHNFDRTMYNILQNLKQDSRSVDEYAEEFYVLLTRTEVADSQFQLVSCFIGGLRSQLQSLLAQFDPTSLSEAHRRAASFEQQHRSASWNTPASRPRPIEQHNSTSASQPRDSKDQTKQEPKFGFREDENGMKRSTRNALKFFSCGEPGHRQNAYTGDPQDDVYDSTKELDDDHHKDNHAIFGDKGVSLVSRQTCIAPPLPHDNWLRYKIFKSTCTIHDRVCTFIIDSGSSRNVISEMAVHKLELTAEPHPRPYSLTWLHEDVDLRVTHRSLVSFSIGPYYKDRFYFDIAPMDISHLVLGRPWELDRKNFHDGEKNTYSFTWETHKITLLSSTAR